MFIIQPSEVTGRAMTMGKEYREEFEYLERRMMQVGLAIEDEQAVVYMDGSLVFFNYSDRDAGNLYEKCYRHDDARFWFTVSVEQHETPGPTPPVIDRRSGKLEV